MRHLLVSFIISALAFLAMPTNALGFGISPADISNEYLKPGAHFEREFFVTRPAEEANEELTIFIETELGEMENWVSYTPGRTFSFPKGERFVPLTIAIDVPRDAVLKKYFGNIKVKAKSKATAQSGGVSLVKGAYVEVDLTVTNKDFSELKVLQMSVPEVKVGDPLTVILKIENSGNSEASPDNVDIAISDLNGNPIEVLSDYTFEAILPHTTREIKAEFDTSIDVGQYWGDITVYFQGEVIKQDKTSFTVLVKPTASDGVGRLINTPINAWVAYAFIILGLVVVVITVIIDLRKGKKEDSDLERKLSKLMHQNHVLLYGLLGAGALMVLIGMYFAKGSSLSYDESEEIKVEETTPTPQEEVQGVMTVAEPQTVVTPFVVKNESKPQYPIYESPSTDSLIIYEAKENEKFDVIDEQGDWYHVIVADEVNGWLHKKSVKSVNQ